MTSRIGITDAQIYTDLADLVREKSSEHADKRFSPMELPQVTREAMDEQFSNGYDTGYSEGSDSAWENGYQTGKKEGFEEGQASMIDESKIIEKTASGVGVLRLDDVSEISHDISISLSEAVPIKVYGKNLFDGNIANLKTVTYANSSGGVGSRIGYEIRLPAGTYTASLVDLNSNYGQRYIYGVINNKNGEYVRTAHLMAASDVETPTVTLQEGDVWYIYNGIGTTTLEITRELFESVNIQIEVGEVATPHETFIYPVDFEFGPDGKGTILSLSPTLTLVARDGVSITVRYRKSFGAQKAYDERWDAYQNNGNAKSYATAFAGVGWNNFTFNPKHDITPTDAYMMFRQTAIKGDLVAICNRLGVKLDFKWCTQTIYAFQAATALTRVGTIDLRRSANASSANYLFMTTTKLVTVDDVILPSTRLNLTDAFTGCVALENITFSGGKIQYNINFKDSKKLTVASTKGIIETLEDYAGTSSEYLYTVSFAPETIALLEAEGNTSPSGGSWVDYITEKGWNS